MSDEAFILDRETQARMSRYRAAMRHLEAIVQAAQEKLKQGRLSPRGRRDQLDLINDVVGAELNLRF